MSSIRKLEVLRLNVKPEQRILTSGKMELHIPSVFKGLFVWVAFLSIFKIHWNIMIEYILK